MPKLTRPTRTQSPITKMPTGCGNLYIAVGYDEAKVPLEVFVTLGKAGGCSACHNEALGRIVSLALKYSVPMSEIAEELYGLSCPSVTWDDGHRISSCADAIGQALKAELAPVETKPIEIKDTATTHTCGDCKHSRVMMWDETENRIMIRSSEDACLLFKKRANLKEIACHAWDPKVKPIEPPSDEKTNLKSTHVMPLSVKIRQGKSPLPCPDCGARVVTEEGCLKCLSCGWTKC